MKRVINGNDLTEVVSAEEIQQGMLGVAYKMKAEYRGKNPTLVLLAKGGLFWGIELATILEKHSFFPEVEIINASRYTGNHEATDAFDVSTAPGVSFEGKDIILVEDLIDEGKTMNGVYDWIQSQRPASIKTAVLCVKEGHKFNYNIDYKVVENLIPRDLWLVGKGMDNNKLLRGLDAIYALGPVQNVALLPVHNLVLFAGHPLIQSNIGSMREKDITMESFRKMIERITSIMGAEVLKNLATAERLVDTRFAGRLAVDCITNIPVIVPVLRTGLLMEAAMLNHLPTMPTGMIGVERVEEGNLITIKEYKKKLPAIAGKNIIVLDPMLATGKSACAAIDILKALNPAKIVFMAILGSDEGLVLLNERHPDVDVYLGYNDHNLLPNKYITPGFGDAGDIAYGTPSEEDEPK